MGAEVGSRSIYHNVGNGNSDDDGVAPKRNRCGSRKDPSPESKRRKLVDRGGVPDSESPSVSVRSKLQSRSR